MLKKEGYPQNQAVAIALSMRDENKLKKGGKVAKTWKQKYNKKYGFDLNESHSLKDISKKTGVSKKGVQAIYNKGVGAWKNNLSSVRVKGSFKKNPNTKKFPRNKRLGKEQWAMARVYSAVMGGKASKVDSKELKMKLGGNILLLFFIACISLNLISCKNWEVVQEIDVNCYHLYNVKTKKVNVLLTKEKLEVGKLYNLKSIEKVDLEDPTIE